MARTGAATGKPHGQWGPTVENGWRGGFLALGSLLLLTWATALWLAREAYQAREAAARDVVREWAREGDETVTRILKEADRTLLALRAFSSDPVARAGAGSATLTPALGAVAFLAPDGRVTASAPEAVTTGWPRLMARVALGGDDLVIGEPVRNPADRSRLVPVARRMIRPDGSFGGLVMITLDSERLLRPSAALEAFGGALTLATMEGVILARVPTPRLSPEDHAANTPPPPENAGSARADFQVPNGPILDGDQRVETWRRLDMAPLLITASVTRDAFLAEWRKFVIRDAATAMLATGLLLLTGHLWQARRRHVQLLAEAFDAVLVHSHQGLRVKGGSGALLAANAEGLALRGSDAAPTGENPPAAGKAGGKVTRHGLTQGATVLIGPGTGFQAEAGDRIAFLTRHDPLTGLPNRWRAASRIQELMAARAPALSTGLPTPAGERTEAATPPSDPSAELPLIPAALILFDLNGFQDVNDTFGHEGGDSVLTEVADRLRGLTSPRDVVARLGGDEFLLFLETPGDDAAIAALSDTVPRILSHPIAVHGQQVRLGASVGIALYPRDGIDATTLFRHASIALSRAKKAGRGRAQVFAPALMASFEEHRMMESDLRRALEGDELELRLQPQFSCETLDVTGFEALARWRHPTRGAISPAVFIPIAERSGLINPLGLWALEHACATAAGWRTRHRVAVNLSPLQLRTETLERDIHAVLHRTQFPAHLLELEVTEGVFLDEDQRILETLHRLRGMDIRITLDDFGTGYSSLSYLRRFPFDKIKIDKSFIQGAGKDRLTRVILETMIRMCSDLGFDVVAEGVETEQELDALRRLGCGEIQGFLLGRPMRTDAVEDFLAAHARRPNALPRASSTAACAGVADSAVAGSTMTSAGTLTSTV